MSGSSAQKPWDRPWTTEELVQNAPNWSLAGDAALLKTLEAFSEDLLTKARNTTDSLDKLLGNLDQASLRLDVVKNEFLSLHNTQFIESRVYEDDETVANGGEQESEEHKETDQEVSDRMAQIVLRSLDVMDKYYEKVEVSVSDSEDDDVEAPHYVLRPIDPYADRPLPFVIGSEEWHKNWHVGLQDSSTDDEMEQQTPEKFSDTDSETDLPVSNRINVRGTSETSSEIDSSHPNADFNDMPKPRDLFESSGSENGNSAPVHAPIANDNFAEQLAAKLGTMFDEQLAEEVNRRPIQKASANDRFQSVVLPEEPPPLGDHDDLFGRNDERGLFDDFDDSESFWGGKAAEDAHTVPDKNVSKLFEPIENAPNLPETQKPQPKPRTLFDDDASDDDLFTVKTTKTKQNATTQNVNAQKPKVSERLRKPEPQISAPKPPKTVSEPDVRENVPETLSLFSDIGDDLFDDDLFSNVTSKTFTSGLFDRAADFEGTKTGLFDDDDDIEDELSINSKQTEKESKREFATKPIEEATKTPSLFDDSDGSSLRNKPEPTVNTPETKNPTSLVDSFDDDTSSMSDLFSSDHRTREPEPKLATKAPNVTLFDPTPPPIFDDDWDAKSEHNLFDDNESEHSYGQQTRPTTSLFDSEPPSLFADDRPSDVLAGDTMPVVWETSRAIEEKPPKGDFSRPIGKLKHSLNINVGALVPGTAPRRLVKSRSTEENVSSVESDVASPFDAPVETLQCVTKDRARIAVKRRPSTRRGRQEQLRKSFVDVSKYDEPCSITDSATVAPIIAAATVETTKPDRPNETRSVFDTTNDPDDIFVARSTPKPERELPKKKINRNLFDSSPESDDDELFKAPKEPKEVLKVVTADLFADDDWLFGKRKPKSESVEQRKGDLFGDEEVFGAKKAVSKVGVKKSSLFGDEDEDEDIFKPKAVVAQGAEIRTVKSAVRKLNTTELTEDPLDALRK